MDDGSDDEGGADHSSGAASVVFSVYHDGEPVESRVAALRARLLDPATPGEDLERVAAALARSRDGGLALIGLAGKNGLPEAVRSAAARAARECPDLTVRALASGAFGGRRPEAPAPENASLRGDAARGREIFFGARAGCASCHAMSGAGRDVGPDLTAIGEKFDRAALLDAIVSPSRAILAGYESVVVETTDGRIFTGFVVADAAGTLTLKESTGDLRAIPAAEIASRRAQTVSSMPDVAALGLSAQDLADVVEFLLAAPR